MASTAVLIPSARLVDPQLRLEVGNIPPVLIPVNGAPLLKSIVESYRSKIDNASFFVLCEEGAELVESYLASTPLGEGVTLLHVDHDTDLAGTIIAGLTTIEGRNFDTVIINFGDTIVDAPLGQLRDAILFDERFDTLRWTIFSSEEGRITEISDKYQLDRYGATQVFTGAFVLSRPADFLDALRHSSGHSTLSRFYVGLQTYLTTHAYELIRVTRWFDFGHIDTYHEAKRLFVNRRFFNTIEIDESRPIVTKRSTHGGKLSDEIRWYLDLPADLRCYAPQIFHYSLDKKSPYVTMEYYGYPSLGDLFVYGSCDLGTWGAIVETLFRVLADVRSHEAPLDRTAIQRELFAMYVIKTIERLDDLRLHPVWRPFFEASPRMNGTEYPPLSRIASVLPKLFDLILSRGCPKFTTIHGDFCLSNILYDPRTRLVKLIDPRGRFGSVRMWGDFRYELAKLSHSFNGFYELIVNNRFFSIVDGTDLSYDIHASSQQTRVATLFNQRLEHSHPDQRLAIDFIESLLFLSMITLHRDHLDRQSVMLGLGVEKFWRIANLYM